MGLVLKCLAVSFICLMTCGSSGCGRSADGRSAVGGFVNVTKSAGLTFVYDNDFTRAHRFVETTGGGCAFFDFDNDGLLDIFAPQGGPAPGSVPRPRPPSALYRNLGNLRFADVTVEVGLDVDMGYGQGTAVADYDNDGWKDLLVTAYGSLHLFRNEPVSPTPKTLGQDGAPVRRRFRDVTRELGLIEAGEAHWNTSAAWADYDRDGFLDLAVCRYVSWFPDIDRNCFDSSEQPMYCAPTAFATDQSVLFRNMAGSRASPQPRRFVDVTKQTGFYAAEGKALGAVWLDYDGDGLQDLYLAHDMYANSLMRNQSGQSFCNVAPMAGVAVGSVGQPLSGMGVTAADFRNLGREDLFVVNFSLQPRSYYLNEGNGIFKWASEWAGVGEANQPFLGFGVECMDYDRDGWIDLVVGNGHINEVLDNSGGEVTYRQRQQLLRNRGDGRFEDDLRLLGDLEAPMVTRGLAVGDFDNDGRSDVLVSGPRQPLQLFRNECNPDRQWIGFVLEGAATGVDGISDEVKRRPKRKSGRVKSNRDGVGAQVRIEASGRKQMRVVRSGSSYCSSSDMRPLFGLGDDPASVKIEVVWPNGQRVDYGVAKPGGYYLLREGGAIKRWR